MPLQSTSGAASYDAFGGGTAAKVNYIEDFFQSYLRTGTGASATVTTGLDGSTKETLVWTKSRSAATNHKLTDNVRGATKALSSNTTGAEATDSQGLTAFSATGYTIGTNTDYNNSGATYVDWQWVAQPKFFDIVTWSGDSTYPRTITHNLGSTPGCIITKNTTESSDWFTYHTSLGNFQAVRLNTTATPFVSSNNMWNVTSTTFTLTADLGMNESASTYVAYIFAHNAGGFGLTGTDNVISCGTFTADGDGNATVNLGYEPQWVMMKATNTTGSWFMNDNMRGMPVDTSVARLFANLSQAENTASGGARPNSTGFNVTALGPNTYIYIAIRRGPMKVPTSGTSVFLPTTYTGNGSTQTITTNFPVDFSLFINRTKSSFDNNNVFDRLRGGTRYLATNVADAESSLGSGIAPLYDSNTGVNLQAATITNGGSASIIVENFKRAPSFFDEVCYLGTGSYPFTINHNLGVVPELIIIKKRSSAENWWVYAKPVVSPNANWYQNYAILNDTVYFQSDTTSFTSSPTSTTIPVASYYSTSAETYVAYLFATCAGVSKVGSYTGTGTTLQIDCGFTSGARFVLIKRVAVAESWYVWDSARGIISGNDPYLLLNSTAAEVTGTDYIDTYSAGFELSSTAPSNINASGGTFLFLAIA